MTGNAVIVIDGIEIKARKGSSLLWTALDNGFYIPNLCAIRELPHPVASCRLCYVEIEGESAPVLSCTRTVVDGMMVRLNTPIASRLRNTAFEFLMSHHQLDCGNCPRHKRCELQDIAHHLKLKLKPHTVRQIARDMPVDSSHPKILFNPNKCVLCGRCVYVCHEKGTGVLDFSYRSIDTRISTFANMPLGETDCTSCMDCVAVCPVGALVRKPAG